MGNAVTACPSGPMAIHYNPAGLLKSKEREFTFGIMYPSSVKIKSKFNLDPDFAGISMEDEKDPVDGTTGETTDGFMRYPGMGSRSIMLVPHAALSRRKPGSKWAFGFGMYSPFISGFHHGYVNDPARFGGAQSYRQRLIYAAPSLACQLSKTLSIGFSVGLGQDAMGEKRDFRAPNEFSSMTEVLGEATENLEIPIISELTLPTPWFNGGLPPYDSMAGFKMDVKDSLAASYNLGLLWEPFTWLSFGACYQSESKSRPTGRYSFKYSDQFKNFCNWFGESPTTVQIATIFALPYYGVDEQKGNMVLQKLIHPRRTQFGIALKPFKILTLSCDLGWTNWSSIKEEKYIFDQDILLFNVANFMGYPYRRDMYIIKRDLKDTWNLSIGLELLLFNRFRLRCGYEERESCTNDTNFSLIFPVQDMKIYSTGLGIKINSGWSIDFSATFIQSDTYHNDYKDGNVMNSDEFFFTLHNPYPGLDYEQTTDITIFGFNINYVW